MARRLHLLAACIVVVLAAAGCGGDNRLGPDEYRRNAAPPVRDAAAAIVKLGLAISRAPAPELAASRLELLRQRLQDASATLDELSPPAEIEDAHDSLVEALASLAEETKEYDDKLAVELEDYEQLTTFSQELSATPAAREITEALRTLDRKGYDLLGSG